MQMWMLCNLSLEKMVKLYTQLLEEMTARFNANGARRSGEPGLLNRTPRTKEEEYDLLKVSDNRRCLKSIFMIWIQSCRSKFTMYVYNHKKNNSLSYLGGTTLHYAIIVKCPIPPFDPHLPLGLVDNARFWIVSLENVYVRQLFYYHACPLLYYCYILLLLLLLCICTSLEW